MDYLFTSISRNRNRDRDTEIYVDIYIYFLVGLVDISLWLSGKETACNARDLSSIPVRSLGQEDCLEKEMATHSSILAWRIQWTEESGGLQSMGLQRVGRD